VLPKTNPVQANLFWTPRGQEDLIEIYLFIGVDNRTAADRIFEALRSRVQSLIHYPRLGVRRPDIRPSTRLLIEGTYLILYETRPDKDEGPIEAVEIIRIVDGRRNLSNIV
jgi:toxin ParE1/3/4